MLTVEEIGAAALLLTGDLEHDVAIAAVVADEFDRPVTEVPQVLTALRRVKADLGNHINGGPL